ncbi:MAG: HAMP domain-containing histidine kinase [Burkholderiaceae bacterium]|nr:HAMP domain-containing histidine kinase [Microbacteriaceae bacterium]
MRVRSWSIRVRITVGSVLIAAVLLVLAAGAIHLQIRSITERSDESLATSDLTPIEADIRSNPTETPDIPASGVLVVILGPQGTAPVETVPRGIHEAIERRRGADSTFQVGTQDANYVVVTRTVATDAGDWHLAAARSTAASDLTVAAIDRSLVIGLVFVLAAFAVAAWLLATAALRPVARMRANAERLGAGDGGGELPVGTADDELSALARTLNAFIARVRTTAARERQMVSDASHELRTPLAVITTQLELAHGSFGDAAALERELRAAEVSLARLSRLATTLLQLSQLEALEATGGAGRGESAASSELVTELMLAVDRARSLAAPDDISVEFEVGALWEGEVYPIAATSFGRILDNLVMNSINACDPGGQVSVDVRQSDGELRVVVTDSGTGIPEEFLPLAFDRFSRPDSSRARSSGGSGLGLALVRALVDRAGGRVDLRNGPSGGAVASVTLAKAAAPPPTPANM